MKIISWNVNGLRAVIKKGLAEIINKQDADIVHLQEAKIDDDAYQLVKLEEKFSTKYHIYTHFATKRKGYSGLVTLSKTKPIDVIYGIGKAEYDTEGRVLALEFDKYYSINTYFPNSSRDLSRLDYKMEFNNDFLAWVKKLKKPAIISGDFNVAHTEIDIARAKQNEGNAGYTDQERKFFTKLMGEGYVDSFRFLNPTTIKYSWWMQFFSAREKNIGWRIDYNVVDKKLEKKLKSADILTEIYGSDHCPVVLEIS